jgi:hypothetical protein
MHKAGETVTSWDFGSASEWLHLLTGMAPYMGLSLLLGAIIAVAVRHQRIRVAATIIASLALYAFFAWWSYDPNVWSWSQPIVSALYQVPLLFGFLLRQLFLEAELFDGFARHFHAQASGSI